MVVFTEEQTLKSTLKQIKTSPCIICNRLAALAIMTAGSLRADGSQAYACTVHLRERRRWIASWAAFDTEQRHLQKQGVVR